MKNTQAVLRDFSQKNPVIAGYSNILLRNVSSASTITDEEEKKLLEIIQIRAAQINDLFHARNFPPLYPEGFEELVTLDFSALTMWLNTCH